MSKKPSARREDPAPPKNETLLKEMERPMNVRIKHDPSFPSPIRDSKGRPRPGGYNVIDPESLPKDEEPLIPKLPSDCYMEAIIVQRSRDGGVFRHRVVTIHDTRALEEAGTDVVYDSGPVRRSSNGLTLSIALEHFRRHMLSKLGVPALVELEVSHDAD